MRHILLLLLAALTLATSGQAPARGALASPAMPSGATARRFLPLVALTGTPPAMPTATPEPQPWRFVVLGDTRTDGLDPPPVTGQIVALAQAHRPEITLANGDLIKALEDQDSVREQWRRWRAVVAPLGHYTSGATWLLPTPGNHDVEDNAWATDLMVEAFPDLPENGPPGLARLAYTFDHRGVRFISLHSEIFGDPHHLGEAQLDWLEAQLQSNPNQYTFVFSHDPAFPVGPHIGSALDVYPAERDRLWAMLQQYHVTAYLAGHEHLYSRQSIDGLTQLVVGTSGSSLYAGRDDSFYHYLVAEVHPDRVEMVVYDSTGVERDRFVL
jgi:Icc protein